MFEIASPRINFTREEQRRFDQLSQGHIGEKLFAALVREKLEQEHIALYGIQLRMSGSECQFDCLLIFQYGIHLFEVKYHQGDYYVEHDKWFDLSSNKERRNPVYQLSRSSIMLQDFLGNHHFQLPVESRLVYNHPEFYLYQALPDTPIIFAGQQHRHIKKINQIPSKLDKLHYKLADRLKASHITDSVHGRLPNFEYQRLRKGVVCRPCGIWMERINQRQLLCPNCQKRESLEQAVIRTIKEFSYLFPDTPINRESVVEWINGVVVNSSLARYLSKNFDRISQGSGTYYEWKKD
jgi:hypothetical protein